MANGLSIELQKAIGEAFDVLSQYLRGTLSLGGATIKGAEHIDIRAKMSGNAIEIAIEAPRPVVTKKLGPIAFQGDLMGMTVTRGEMLIRIDGLPDHTIKLT